MTDMRFDAGATHLLVGPSASGKTFRVCNLLRCKRDIIKGGENIKNVVFCYAVWQPVYEQLKKEGVVTKFVNEKPDVRKFLQLVKPHVNSGGSICVIDDFMGQIDESLLDIVTVHSRHSNTSTFLLFQSLFPANRLARQISLNVKYMHVHKNPRENAQILTLARQVSPTDYKWIVDAYHECTEKPHTSFLIDMTQQCDEGMRFRSNYLPSERPMTCYVKSHSDPSKEA